MNRGLQCHDCYHHDNTRRISFHNLYFDRRGVCYPSVKFNPAMRDGKSLTTVVNSQAGLRGLLCWATTPILNKDTSNI